MRTRMAAFSISALIALVGASVCSASGQADSPGKIELRILYAGHPKSSREKDFVRFLDEHFLEVETADLKKFDEKLTEGFDVTILDYDGDGFKAPRPTLSQDYARATVTVGVTGALICDQQRLKSGYL